MWGKINAEKLKSEMSTNREAQQQQSVDSEKTKILDRHVKLDSGFLSGDHLSLSCDEVLPVFDDQFIENDVFNETSNLDSGCLDEKLVPNDCLSDPFEFDITNTPDKPKNDRSFYFQQNEDGDTYLHLAIIHEYVQVAKRLISICPNPKLLDIRNDDGQSALHLAVLTNQCEIVKSLMMADANAELLDFNGNTAVHLACYGGKLDCLKIIANYAYLPKILDTINYDGLACIHIATIHNHLNTLKFVLHCSKNVNITDYKSGYTALHFAIALDRDNLIESLLEKVDPDIESYAGKFASEVKDDYDYEDEEDDEISDDLVKSIDVLRFPSDSSIKC